MFCQEGVLNPEEMLSPEGVVLLHPGRGEIQ